jgi:anti-sigma regulatory factor (Ser/Thr protein kinase)
VAPDPATAPILGEPVVPSNSVGLPDLDGYRWQRWSLPAVVSSVPCLRQSLRSVLDDTLLSPDQVHDLLLAVGEAVSNAIEHAQNPSRPRVDMTVEVADSRVTVEVKDYGAWRPGPTGPHRGRGLALLSALADTTVTTARSGTTVTIRGPSPNG